MIDVETALLMVTRQGYSEEEVLPLLSESDKVLFQWSIAH